MRFIEQAGRGGRAWRIASLSPAQSPTTSWSRLYRDALCLVYVPFDEDYGLATLEAFLAAKPVVTARDSGGTLEFVRDGENGFVVEPDAAAIAARDRDARRRSWARASLGADGRDAGPHDFLGYGRRSSGEPWLTRRRHRSSCPAFDEETAVAEVVAALRQAATVARDHRRRRRIDGRDRRSGYPGWGACDSASL